MPIALEVGIVHGVLAANLRMTKTASCSKIDTNRQVAEREIKPCMLHKQGTSPLYRLKKPLMNPCIDFLCRLLCRRRGKIFLIVDRHPVYRRSRATRWLESHA